MKSQHRPFCGHLAFEANWKGEKLNKWVPCELASSCHLEVSSSFILPKNKEPFLNWIVMCDKKWILYDNQ